MRVSKLVVTGMPLLCLIKKKHKNMKKLEKLRDLDDLIHAEFEKYFPKAMTSNFSKKFPKTFLISNLFTNSTNFIKNSIFDCSETDDLFGVKILFRSLIEHFLRFQYVNFNWIKCQTDEVSKRYLEFTEAREKLDQIKVAIAQHKLSNPEFEIKSWNKIFEDIPSLKKYSKKEIEEETLKYTYQNIIKTLKEIGEKSKTETSIFSSLIREYSELSSFVHGGAGAHNQIIFFNEQDKREIEYLRIGELAYQMAGTVKLLTLLMIVQTDKESFEGHYLVLYELIKRVNEI